MIKTVKCVDAFGRKRLTEGNVYNVVAIQPDGDYVIIDDSGKEVKVLEDRFIDIDSDDEEFDFDDSDDDVVDASNEIIKTVKCIDASGRKYLTEGNSYEVVELQYDGDYVVLDDRSKEVKVAKSRFVDIVTRPIPAITNDAIDFDTEIPMLKASENVEFTFQFQGTMASWKAFISTLK